MDIFVTSDWDYIGVYASDGDNEHFLMYGSAGVHALGGNRYVAVYCSTYSYSLSSYQNAPGALISRKFNIDGLAITMNTAPLHFHAVPQLAPTAGRYTNYSSSTMWIDDGQHLVLLTPTSYNAIGMGMAFVLSFNSAGSISRVVVSDLPRLDVGYAMPAVRGGKMRRYATWVSGGNVTDLFQGDLYRATKTTHSYGDSRYQIGPREWWDQNNHWPVAASHVAACLRIDDGLQLEIDSVDAGTTTAAEMVLVPGAQDMPNACPTGLEEILFTASGYVVGRQPDAVPLFTFLVIWSVTLDDLTAGTGVVKGYFA